MTTDVIAVTQGRKSGFVRICVLFQTFDSFFNQAAESGTDFKSFARIWGSVFQGHSKTPRAERLKIIVRSTHVSSATADRNDEGAVLPDYEVAKLA
jgi:hypothetical protein